MSPTRSPVGEYSAHEAGVNIQSPRYRRSPVGAVAAQQRAQPGEQLVEVEGLDQIVVGAGIQSLDAVVDRAERRQQQDRRRDAGGAHGRDELERHPSRAVVDRRA